MCIRPGNEGGLGRLEGQVLNQGRRYGARLLQIPDAHPWRGFKCGARFQEARVCGRWKSRLQCGAASYRGCGQQRGRVCLLLRQSVLAEDGAERMHCVQRAAQSPGTIPAVLFLLRAVWLITKTSPQNSSFSQLCHLLPGTDRSPDRRSIGGKGGCFAADAGS